MHGQRQNFSAHRLGHRQPIIGRIVFKRRHLVERRRVINRRRNAALAQGARHVIARCDADRIVVIAGNAAVEMALRCGDLRQAIIVISSNPLARLNLIVGERNFFQQHRRLKTVHTPIKSNAYRVFSVLVCAVPAYRPPGLNVGGVARQNCPGIPISAERLAGEKAKRCCGRNRADPPPIKDTAETLRAVSQNK